MRFSMLLPCSLLFCASILETQDTQHSTSQLIVTVGEFQLSTKLPPSNSNTCINVWEDGRFHLERRAQLGPKLTPTLQVYDSELPAQQLSELRSILDSSAVRELPAPIRAPANDATKIWVRGVEAKIDRGTTIQTVGYSQWGFWENPSSTPQSLHEIVHAPQPEVEAALKPLEELLPRVSSVRLTQSTGEGNFCGVNP